MFVVKNKSKIKDLYLVKQEPIIEGSCSMISFSSDKNDAWKFEDQEFAKFVSYYLNFKYNYQTIVNHE